MEGLWSTGDYVSDVFLPNRLRQYIRFNKFFRSFPTGSATFPLCPRTNLVYGALSNI
jgi:hypothetical protein